MTQILIAESDASMIVLYRHYFQYSKLTFAKDGKEFLKLYKVNFYNVLIISIKFPVVSGIGILQSLSKSFCTLPILVVTTQYPVEYPSNLNIKYIQKPIPPNFLQIVQNFIKDSYH